MLTYYNDFRLNKAATDEIVDIIATYVDEDIAEPTAPAQPVIPFLLPLAVGQIVGAAQFCKIIIISLEEGEDPGGVGGEGVWHAVDAHQV